jgi:hypothetical protein
MKDLAVTRSVRDFLSGIYNSQGIHVGSAVDAESVQMPCILLSIHSRSAVGSPLYRGTLSVAVNTLANITTQDAHTELCEAVDQSVRTITGLSGHGSTVDGVVATDVNQHPSNQHFATVMDYIIGFH